MELKLGNGNLAEGIAFSETAQQMPSWKWAKTYMAKWPTLVGLVMRIVALECSASGCEHFWSVEGWIHSKKRNRLGQTMVERLLRMHTKLSLENILKVCFSRSFQNTAPFLKETDMCAGLGGEKCQGRV